MDTVSLLGSGVVGNFRCGRDLVNLAADPPGDLTERSHVQNVLWGEVSYVSAVGDVAGLREGDIIGAEEALRFAVVLLQCEGLQPPRVAVEAPDLDKVAWDYACWGVVENLLDEIAAEVVDDFGVKGLHISYEGAQDQQLDDVDSSADAGSLPLVLIKYRNLVKKKKN